MPAGALWGAPPRVVAGAPPRASVPRIEGVVWPASRPRTPAWLPRASTPLRGVVLPERKPSLRPTPAPSDERLWLLTERLEPGVLDEERLTLLDEERLGLLLTDERLLLDEERLKLLLLDEWLLPDERLLLTELLWLPPPPRLPPLRCAKAGVALNASAIIMRVIAFEVFMLLLLSFLVSFSAAKVQPFPEGISANVTYFSTHHHNTHDVSVLQLFPKSEKNRNWRRNNKCIEWFYYLFFHFYSSFIQHPCKGKTSPQINIVHDLLGFREPGEASGSATGWEAPLQQLKHTIY